MRKPYAFTSLAADFFREMNVNVLTQQFMLEQNAILTGRLAKIDSVFLGIFVVKLWRQKDRNRP